MNVIAYAFKDLKAQKVRTILGVFGISVSIFLLSTVSFLTDSVSASYVDFLTLDSGNIDIDISQRYLTGDQENVPRYFNYTDMSQKIENVTGENINGYIPRVIERYSANISNTDVVNWFYFIGLNISHEEDLNFGQILTSDYDFVSNGIPQGNCAISEDLSVEMGLRTGDTLNISRGRDYGWVANNSKYMNLTICAVFTVSLKFPSYMDELCLVDLKDIAYVYSLGDDNFDIDKDGKSNHLLLTLANSDLLYDVRDISGSELKIESIGAEIQLEIGYNYWVAMPKLDDLDDSELISLLTSILFVLIGLISMLISIILITGIISTAVEERIREFGIFRCLGAHKSFNLKLVLFEGILICLGGTTLGILASIITVSGIILPLVGLFVPNSTIIQSITFVVKPLTVISIYSLGVTVGITVSVSPAIKVMRMEIVQAINPYRHEEELYKLVRESKVNLKIVLVGAILATNGGVVFFLIPRLFLSLEISLLLNTFIIILLVFLIGLTMAGVGIMPIFLRFWIAIFTPFFRKLMNIIKVTIFRHQRRNLTTILMFCLSFSFVIFSASEIDTQLTQFSALVEFNRGSELIIYRSGTGLYNPTTDIQNELMQVEGIERTSLVIASPDLLTQIYAADGKTFSAEIGDHLNFKSSEISLFGIDSNYQNAVYSNYIAFTQGNSNAFDNLHNGTNTCIISEAISKGLSLNLNDAVRVTFNRGDEQSFEEFIIVGVADKLPGFSEFRGNTLEDPGGGGGGGLLGGGGGGGGGLLGGGNEISISSNGVLISKEKYIEYMSIPNPAWIDQIYIKLIEDPDVDPAAISEEIEEVLGDRWDFYVFNVPAAVAELNEIFNIIEIVLLSILSLTIVICMFGLFSSSYSSILERKREIGILRALGLRRDGVSILFTVESLIIMLGAGTTGMVVGFSTAALMTENLVIFTGSPRLLTFPWFAVLMLFTIAIVVLLFGMKILLSRIKKKNLIQIFRETT